MKAAAAMFALTLSGCAILSPPTPAPAQCPPLPEFPEKATASQQTAYLTVIVRLYAQCAEGRK